MTITLAHLGPQGTYAEAAAIACADWWYQRGLGTLLLAPYPSIGQTLEAVTTQAATFAIVPMENSTEGSVTMTLDALWQLELLKIRQAWVMPVAHALLSYASIDAIDAIYSHPQALAQCQRWLEAHFPEVALVPTRSTAEAVRLLEQQPTAGAIAS
ncbi:MAG: prephenate dehydratase domain-containing protein, partial [Cyanobacteria bacterium P01_A01_bin.135]